MSGSDGPIRMACGDCREATFITEFKRLCPVSLQIKLSGENCCYSLADLWAQRQAAWYRMKRMERMIKAAQGGGTEQAVREGRGILKRLRAPGRGGR